MKKLLAIILAAIMVFSFTACGGSSSAKGAEGTGIWKVTYSDGRVSYYDVFSNGSNWLSCQRVVNAEGGKNILELFGGDNFDYLAESGYIGVQPANTYTTLDSIISGDYFYYDTKLNQYKEEFIAEAKRVKENGTKAEQDAFFALALDIDESYYFDTAHKGELRWIKNADILITLNFKEQYATVTEYNSSIDFEGNSKKFTINSHLDWNDPFVNGAVWERVGSTEHNSSKLSIKNLSDLNGLWKIESYDESGNVKRAMHLQLAQKENEDCLSAIQVASNGSENILEDLTIDAKKFLLESGYADEYEETMMNWHSGNFTFEEDIAYDFNKLLAGTPYLNWSNFGNEMGEGQKFVAPYLKQAAESLKNEDLKVKFALSKFYRDINQQVEKYSGGEAIKGLISGANWNSEGHFFGYASDSITTLSGDAKKLVITEGFFAGFPVGSVLTRVK